MNDTIRSTQAGRTSVLIVGAGPTGLALACDLRSRGIDVTIIDKAMGPATTSRALGVQPRGTEILARLGALGDLPQRAVHATGLNIYAGERQLLHIALPATASAANPGVLLIGQTEIEAQLRARLAELQREIAWGTELVSAEECDTGLKVTIRTQSEDEHVAEHVVRADWLVGCDGAHSKTRKLAGIGFEGTAFAERFLLADVRMDWSRPRQETASWLHADGMFVTMPLPGPDIWRVMAELPADIDGVLENDGATISDAAAIDLLHRLLRERVGDTATLISDPSWVSLFRFHRRLASSYRHGRILLAGDAAHIHSPFGGQGMNTGLGDAFNLGWKLALVVQGRATDRLLDSYEAERRPVAADVLATTTTNTNLLLGNSTSTRLVRDHVFLPLLRLPAVQRRLAANASQLNVSYRTGPLAHAPGAASRLAGFLAARLPSKPRAGDRGPNAPCRLQPSGTVTTLGDQIATGWALLLFGDADEALSACADAARARLGKDIRVVRISPQARVTAPDAEDCAAVTLEDHCGAIARCYRPSRVEAVLLRPDGHLAWRAARPSVAKLREWLGRTLDDGENGRSGQDETLPAARYACELG